jgi:hypothetical protein
LVTLNMPSFILNRAEITAITCCSDALSPGLRFHHQNSKYPPLITFESRARHVVIAALEANGYAVSNKPVSSPLLPDSAAARKGTPFRTAWSERDCRE